MNGQKRSVANSRSELHEKVAAVGVSLGMPLLLASLCNALNYPTFACAILVTCGIVITVKAVQSEADILAGEMTTVI